MRLGYKLGFSVLESALPQSEEKQKYFFLILSQIVAKYFYVNSATLPRVFSDLRSCIQRH
jgi:hypothetical protein